MNNFNYNNYIGEHMDEPLRVELSYSFTNKKYDSELTIQTLVDFEENDSQEYCKPLIKSPSDLTDEEWLFVFGREELKDRSINKWNNEYIEHLSEGNLYNEFNTRLNEFTHCDQELLNRLYSLHSHPQAKQLIEKGLALNKKDLK